jgi:ribosomal protein S18 acetylase RimI-like enzyme
VSSRFDVTVWYLQMHEAPARSEAVPPEGVSVVRAMSPSTHFYRYLYETVGAPWLWVERRRMPDEELAAILLDDDVHLYVAYSNGVPAGYFELDARRPLEVEIAYFGLMPEQIGRGLGRWMMQECLARAWALPGSARVWVHTCSLDHPRALGNYEAAGMVRYDVREETVWDPRPLPISPR